MRTTVDIDPHLLKRLRQAAHEQGVSLKEVLHRALQRGLETPRAAPRLSYRCPTFSMGAPPGPLDRALALADALEAEEVAREMTLRK
jgi:hypothetical protein